MLTVDVDPESNLFVIEGSALDIQRLKATCANRGIRIVKKSRDAVVLAPDSFLQIREFDGLDFDLSHRASENYTTARSGLDAHITALSVFAERLSADEGLIPDLEIDVLQTHQKQAVWAMSTPGIRGMCLFDEQGVGKTLTTIATFINLKRENTVEQMIVVAPKTLLGGWANEITAFFSKLKLNIVEVSGSSRERYKKTLEKADVFLTSFETLKSDNPLFFAIAKRKQTLLVVDESFFVKNSDSQRSQAVSALREFCAPCFVLCGTPAPNSAVDIVNQVNLADQGWAFRDFTPSGDPDGDFEAISRRLAESAPVIRRVKNVVLPNLPPKEFEVVRVSMTERQRDLYHEARTTMRLYLESLNEETFRQDFTTYLSLRTKLSQICVDTRLVGDVLSASSKYPALLEICSNILGADEKSKVVVWSHFTKSTDVLERLLAPYGVVRVDGSVTSPSVRHERVKSFQEDSQIRIFLGNPAAAGAGLTLTAASVSIYVSWSLQAAHYMQSIDRTHRIGQNAESVRYLFLVNERSIEERDIQLISEKQSRQADLLQDPLTQRQTLADAIEEFANEV